MKELGQEIMSHSHSSGPVIEATWLEAATEITSWDLFSDLRLNHNDWPASAGSLLPKGHHDSQVTTQPRRQNE